MTTSKKTILLCLFLLPALCAFSQNQRDSLRTVDKQQLLNKRYCTGLFRNSTGTILAPSDQQGAGSYRNILDWLEGRVAGLRIGRSAQGRIPLLRGKEPAIFLDEIQVSAGLLASINVSDIALVKVINAPFPGGANGENGAIAIYTFKGEEGENGP